MHAVLCAKERLATNRQKTTWVRACLINWDGIDVFHQKGTGVGSNVAAIDAYDQEHDDHSDEKAASSTFNSHFQDVLTGKRSDDRIGIAQVDSPSVLLKIRAR